MGPAVLWTLVIYAGCVALIAGWLGWRVRRPRTAPGALMMLGVLVAGGLATSASAWLRCVSGGQVIHPEILWPSLAAWAALVPCVVWSVRRLLPLARAARRR